MLIVPVIIRTSKQLIAALFMVYLALWISILLFSIFILGNEINTLMNIALILLIVITIVGYILGERYLKKQK